MNDRLYIFDTTLRDGEQSPGASMTRDEKLRIARQLEKLGVDVIEAGFAVASPGDADAIKAIAESIVDATVCSLARANERDIRAAGEAIEPARSGRIHTFIATSPIHMEKKLRMHPDQVLDAAVKAVKLAREYTDDVEFSAEDAVRSDLDFLCRIFAAVIAVGAKTINVPDTVGYSIPSLWGERMKQLIERVPGSDKVIWSTHCHNDLGMAVANSLAAVMAGARQVECPSMAWVSEPATLRSRKSSWPFERVRMCFGATAALMRPRSSRHQNSFRLSPDTPCSPIRRLSEPMPLRMSRAYTRMGCSNIGRPMKSCGRRT